MKRSESSYGRGGGVNRLMKATSHKLCKHNANQDHINYMWYCIPKGAWSTMWSGISIWGAATKCICLNHSKTQNGVLFAWPRARISVFQGEVLWIDRSPWRPISGKLQNSRSLWLANDLLWFEQLSCYFSEKMALTTAIALRFLQMAHNQPLLHVTFPSWIAYSFSSVPNLSYNRSSSTSCFGWISVALVFNWSCFGTE